MPNQAQTLKPKTNDFFIYLGFKLDLTFDLGILSLF